jgi:signal peptidase II
MTGVGTDTPRPAARDAALWPIFASLAGLVLVLDQLAKAWIVGRLDPGEGMSVVGDTIRLVYTRNSGALFGLFRDQALLFAIVSIGVVGLIVVYHARSGRSLLASVALGLLLGGALGNLVDRLRLGYVVDFVDVGIGDLRFYTFNVADSSISLAILLLIIMALRPETAATAKPAESAEPAARPADDTQAPTDGPADG